MYNDEIQRLQRSELSLDDLDLEDSLFIQESKLKRKVGLEDVKLDGSRNAVFSTRYSTSSVFPPILFS